MHCIKYARIKVFSDLYFPLKGQNVASVLLQESTAQRNHILWHILLMNRTVLTGNVKI